MYERIWTDSVKQVQKTESNEKKRKKKTMNEHFQHNVMQLRIRLFHGCKINYVIIFIYYYFHYTHVWLNAPVFIVEANHRQLSTRSIL